MDSPTVFVVPPNNALHCPLHHGLFEDPVSAPCGCTYCRSCIVEALKTQGSCPADETHTAPLQREMLVADLDAQDRVDELLIHCKYGLRKDSEEGWVPSSSPNACKMWLNLGKREDHEVSCKHKSEEDDFCMVEGNSIDDDFEEYKASSSDIEGDGHPINGDISEPEVDESDADSSFSTASSSSSKYALSSSTSDYDSDRTLTPPIRSKRAPEDIEDFLNIEDCNSRLRSVVEREEMMGQISVLTTRLAERDEEIRRLQSLLDEARQAKSAMPQSSEKMVSDVAVSSKQDIYISLAKGFSILEGEGQRALEDAAETLQKTKTAIKNSEAYQQSMRTFAQIKQAFAEVHEDIVAKFASLFDKPESISQPEQQRQQEVVVEEDSELNAAMKLSEESFKQDAELRSREEDSIRQALCLSLMDQPASL